MRVAVGEVDIEKYFQEEHFKEVRKMASSFPSFPERERGPSRVLGLLRRRPRNLSQGENGIMAWVRQAIGGVWLLILLIVLIPLLLLVILGSVIFIIKIISLFGVLL